MVSAAEPVRTFAEVWTTAASIPGWLTEAQAEELWKFAAGTHHGLVVEIGSHQGRSTVVLGAAAALSDELAVVAIDPFVAGDMFGGAPTRQRFEANLAAAGLTERVELIVARSTDLRSGWTRPIDLLYIDGKHDYWTVTDDLRWAEHVPAGGVVLIHDAFSSIGVTLALLAHVLPSRRVRYSGRVGSLAVFAIRAPDPFTRLRMLAQLPWFARNVVVKIALRVGRLVGYHRPDPF